MDLTLTPVARVHSCFEEKFGVPRQPALAPSSRARLELLPPWNTPDAVAGLAEVSHLWLQFGFHLSPASASPKVRPPRLGGNRKLGVFATRSPVRPNRLGLSVVRLVRIDCSDGVCLHIAGHDLVQGTPVYDIKPYLPYVDAVTDACNGLADAPPTVVPVAFAPGLSLPDHLADLVIEVLQQDPRPAYQRPGPERIYGMRLSGGNLRWRYLPGDQAPDALRIEVLSFTMGDAHA